jgi:hypothetical protein
MASRWRRRSGVADQEETVRALEQVAKEAGRMISEFGRKVHFHEYADEREIGEAITHIVRAIITNVIDVLAEKAAAERARFDA